MAWCLPVWGWLIGGYLSSVAQTTKEKVGAWPFDSGASSGGIRLSERPDFPLYALGQWTQTPAWTPEPPVPKQKITWVITINVQRFFTSDHDKVSSRSLTLTCSTLWLDLTLPQHRLTIGLGHDSSIIGWGVSGCGRSMLGEPAPSGERTVMLGCLFVFLAACRAGEKKQNKKKNHTTRKSSLVRNTWQMFISECNFSNSALLRLPW